VPSEVAGVDSQGQGNAMPACSEEGSPLQGPKCTWGQTTSALLSLQVRSWLCKVYSTLLQQLGCQQQLSSLKQSACGQLSMWSIVLLIAEVVFPAHALSVSHTAAPSRMLWFPSVLQQLGWGLWLFPAAYARLGWLPGIGITLLMALTSVYSGTLFTRLYMAVPEAGGLQLHTISWPCRKSSSAAPAAVRIH
jgi:hypothetical protein